MDKHKELSFWIVFLKTMKSLIIRHENIGSWWCRARPILFFAFGGLLLFSFYLGHLNYLNRSINYPNYEQMFLDKGLFKEIKIGRLYFFELAKENGEKILFEKSGADTAYRRHKENSNNGFLLVAVQWFWLPTNKGWINQLWIEDQCIFSQEDAKKNYDSKSAKYGMFWLGIACLIFLIWIIVSEYRYVKNKLSEEVKNGK
ncbi:MAG: hypothetical protein RBR12_11575 [Sulfurospirillum cavolei]|nr:hypothetical protein [Sulfurospirillum cavolei]